jgi:hypothetical protein
MKSKKPGSYDANKVEYTDAVKSAGGSKFPKVQEAARLAVADCNGGAKEAENKIRGTIGEGAQDIQADMNNITNPNKK